jgi:hypothetical protein
MKQTNSKAEDSFEQARQEFFGSGEKIIKRTSPLPSSSRREAILAIQVVRPPRVFGSSRIALDQTIITIVAYSGQPSEL